MTGQLRCPVGVFLASREPGVVDAIAVYELGQALSRLEGLDPQQGRVVELRYFGGMTIEEAFPPQVVRS